MSIWDTLIGNETKVETKTDFWDSLIGVPVKQDTAVDYTAKQSSKTVEQAEQVYETVDQLIVPSTDCTHHWMIGAGSKWTIGTCILCNGEKWFNNSYAEQVKFNDSLVSPIITAKPETRQSMESDLDVQDLAELYRLEQNNDLSVEEAE